MLFNISNHPSSKWGDVQRKLAEDLWDKVVDIPFPAVDPLINEEEVEEIADNIIREHLPETTSFEGDVFLVQGEFTLTFALVKRLQALGATCVVATSERNTVENPDGSKTVRFEFCQFREYPS